METHLDFLIYHKQGFSCAQSVLAYFADRFEVPIDLALKISVPFSGGISRLGQMCGAVSAGIMVIGLAYGNTTPEDKAAKEKTFQLTQEFVNQFKLRNGALSCTDLLGYDLAIPEQRQAATDQNLFKCQCPDYVQSSIEIIHELFEQNPYHG
jgi:C_GCAxxG_C_C family probable redox protein